MLQTGPSFGSGVSTSTTTVKLHEGQISTRFRIKSPPPNPSI